MYKERRRSGFWVLGSGFGVRVRGSAFDVRGSAFDDFRLTRERVPERLEEHLGGLADAVERHPLAVAVHRGDGLG
jgi:hypothetical protein